MSAVARHRGQAAEPRVPTETRRRPAGPRSDALGSDDLFGGLLSGFSRALTLDEAPNAIATADLADPDCFHPLIDRFGTIHGAADRRAVISLWTQTYFNRLIIPAVTLLVANDLTLALDFGALRASFCPTTGQALAFHLPEPPGTGVEGPPIARFTGLLDRHISPLIAVVRRHGGLSARLLWENAGGVLIWTLGEVARQRPASLPLVRAVLEDESWPTGLCGSLAGMKTAALAGEPMRRRLCCLRYQLPGFGYCGGICPNEGRCEQT